MEKLNGIFIRKVNIQIKFKGLELLYNKFTQTKNDTVF